MPCPSGLADQLVKVPVKFGKGVIEMANVSQETMMFKRNREKAPVEQTVREVCDALTEKGYNPKDQLVGYLLSGDPTYITSYKDARNKLRQYERYELVEALLETYLAVIRK